MTTVRLNDDLEKKLTQYAETHSVSKSEIIKEALVQYLSKKTTGVSPYDLGADLFESVGSDDGSLSTKYKSKLKEQIYDKTRPR